MSPGGEQRHLKTTPVGCWADRRSEAVQPSDVGLVTVITRGEHEAFRDAYPRHGAQVHALTRRVCDGSQAEDAVQEVFLRLWHKPERFEPGRGSLRTFLLTDAHGRAIDFVRSNAARRARESADFMRRGAAGVDASAAAALGRLTGDDVLRLLSALDDSQRAAIGLAYFGGYTYCEVADPLEQPEGTIKSRMRSGFARLCAGLPDVIGATNSASPDATLIRPRKGDAMTQHSSLNPKVRLRRGAPGLGVERRGPALSAEPGGPGFPLEQV